MQDGQNIITKEDIIRCDNTGITCCFTGHRELERGRREEILIRLQKEIAALYARGYRVFANGGALGFDTVAAQTVLSMRDGAYPELRLRMVLPCRSQDKKWNAADREIYGELLRRADEVFWVAEDYYSGCMYARNRALVEMSSFCIAYQTHSGGGTDYTVRYAQNFGISVLKFR